MTGLILNETVLYENIVTYKWKTIGPQKWANNEEIVSTEILNDSRRA